MIQVNQEFLSRVLNHYRDAILQHFGYKILTPAMVETMQRWLQGYQFRLIQTETHPAWSAPLKVIYDKKSMCIDVEVDNPNFEVVK